MQQRGTVLAGRYRVVRHVGSGGMGSVYLAHDEMLGREVAVKTVHAEPDSDHGRRIMREARLGAGLRHPHLVTVFDVVAEDAALLLVMEYVEGETLADALRRGPLETARALEVLRAVADALDHAHGEGIVHRDVKPANILLGAAGAVKLADLGIATAGDSTRITRTGGTPGTVAYMAPEQFEPGPATPAADVYALAAVAFEALAGRRAFPGATAFEIYGRVREGATAPDPRDARPDLPEPAARALQRGLATSPADRPASARALVDEIEESLAGRGDEPATGRTAPMPALEPSRPATPAPTPEPQPARPAAPAREPRTQQRRRPALVPLALLAVLAVVGALVLLSSGDGDDDPADEPARTEASGTTPDEPGATAAERPERPATPETAVRALYERAAEGDLRGAWRLAGPGMREAFGNSRSAFEGDLGSLRAITFTRLEQTQASGSSAIVEVATVAEHTDRTDRCSGTLRTVRGPADRWLVEPHGLSCTSG